MKQGTFAAIALGALLAGSPLLAQGDTPASTPSQPAAQAGQSDPNPAPGAQASDAERVTGTVVSLSASSLEVKVEPAATGATGEAAEMAGKSISFALSAATDLPTGIRVGDRVSVWYTESNGNRPATRVALAETGGSSSMGTESATTGSASRPSDEGQGSSSAQSTTPATGTTAQSSGEQTQPAAAVATETKHLPRTASPLPLIGLVGLVALTMALVVRFALRSS